MKKQGVESRRTPNLRRQRGDHVSKKSKISTRSAYDRRIENKKRGALEASKKRKLLVPGPMEEDGEGSAIEIDEFAGLEE